MKTRRNDSCISFSTPNSQTECCFGLVLKILLDRNQLSALLVSPLTIKGREYQLPQSDCGIGVSHIVCVSSDPNHLQLIPVENVLCKCLLLELSGDFCKQYACIWKSFKTEIYFYWQSSYNMFVYLIYCIFMIIQVIGFYAYIAWIYTML
jgi:hypothetical protein